MLTDLAGFKSLEVIEGEVLFIWNNDNLQSLYGLSSLKKINGDLLIGHNPKLNSLINLLELDSINGEIIIENNEALTSLQGLNNINPNNIKRLKIFRCKELSECSIQNICQYLNSDFNTHDISQNKINCNSKEEIKSNCNLSSTNDKSFFPKLSVYPNPVYDHLSIETEIDFEIKIYNSSGGLVSCNRLNKNLFSLKNIPPGLYFLSIYNSSNGYIFKKIIKK